MSRVHHCWIGELLLQRERCGLSQVPSNVADMTRHWHSWGGEAGQKSMMGVGRSAEAARGGGYWPSPRAGFESNCTSLDKVLSLTVPQCPHL